MNAFIFGSAIEFVDRPVRVFGLLCRRHLQPFPTQSTSSGSILMMTGVQIRDARSSRIEPPTATQRARVPEPTVVRAERKPVITLKH